MISPDPLTLATSFEFLRLCRSVGIVKVGANLLLKFSTFSFVVFLRPLSELSVRGELCRAIHKKEEEEWERSGSRLFSIELVLSRSNGLTKYPTKSQVRTMQSVNAAHHMPP